MLKKRNPLDKIVQISDLEGLREYYSDRTIVFTVGCYDVLHRGHIFYLNQCANMGDILVVGLAHDSTVKLLKGPTRPIFKELDRLYALASLESVDYALLNEEMVETGRAKEYHSTKIDFKMLLENLHPDIFAMGRDTVSSSGKISLCETLGISPKIVIEQILFEEKILSTTSLIKKIKERG